MQDTGASGRKTTSPLVWDYTSTWGHPLRSPAPAIDQHIWAIDVDRDIKVNYEQSVFMGDHVLRLDVEVGDITAMQICDAIHQLATEIRTLVAEHLKLESKIQGSGFQKQDQHPHIQFERHN